MSPIWHNPKLTNSQLFFPHWYHKGIVCIADVILRNGRFMTLNEIRCFYNIETNFLEYQRVLTLQSRIAATLVLFTVILQILLSCPYGCIKCDFESSRTHQLGTRFTQCTFLKIRLIREPL